MREDVQTEQVKAFVKKYGFWIVIAMIVILTIAVSFESIKAKRADKSAELTESFAYAISLQNQGRYKEALDIYKKIEDSGNDIYEAVAKIQISNIYFEQGNIQDAVALLQKIVDTKGLNKELHDMSVVKLATYKLDTAPKAEVETLLMPVATSSGSWSNIAKEMLAMLYIREGDMAKAKEFYQNILNSPTADDDLRARVKDMIATLKSEI